MNYIEFNAQSPVKFLAAGKFTTREPWKLPQRKFENFVLMIGYRNPFYIQQYEQKYEVTENDVLLLLPGVAEGFSISAKDLALFWIEFTCDYKILTESDLDDKIAPTPLSECSYLTAHIISPVFFRASDMDKLIILCKQILHISESNYYIPYAMDYLTTVFLIELSQQFLSCRLLRKANAGTNKFPEIIEWLNINISKTISLSDLAFEFNYSREYIARLFKKNTGFSVHNYINRMRITKAKELLFYTDHTIKEIANLVGYSDDKYFMRLFKNYEHMTPKELRYAYNRTHMNNT